MKSIGLYVIFMGSLFTKMETFKTYVKRTVDEAMLIGINSLTLVTIVSTFIGMVTTVQTAANLISPFVPTSVISTVVREMTILELAPTITSVVLAGKVGSNIASELGTMRITEQIDALEVMGINSSSYLVFPKIVAAIIMFPLLVILAGFLGLYGGYLVGTLTGVVTAEDYIYGLRLDFRQYYIFMAIVKAIVFGFIVASVSSYKGFYVRGGSLEVGQASTNAVTNSCISILLADFLIAQLFL